MSTFFNSYKYMCKQKSLLNLLKQSKELVMSIKTFKQYASKKENAKDDESLEESTISKFIKNTAIVGLFTKFLKEMSDSNKLSANYQKQILSLTEQNNRLLKLVEKIKCEKE